MNNLEAWYIIKQNDQKCEIISQEPAELEKEIEILEKWGPFNSQDEAIARRVGLIRAGKCQPR